MPSTSNYIGHSRARSWRLGGLTSTTAVVAAAGLALACQPHTAASQPVAPPRVATGEGSSRGATVPTLKAPPQTSNAAPLPAAPQNVCPGSAAAARGAGDIGEREPSSSSGTSCGALECRGFARAEDAVAYVLRETSPLVLAVGEIHVQKDSAIVSSPTQRFAALLPQFCGKARHIIIELWTGRNDCGDARVEAVARAQKPVTSAQAATNKNDFFELGNVAKSNRIQPHALTPTCEDYQSILASKDQDIARMLELTATRTADLAEELLKRPANSSSSPAIILYGGAMHNDVSPSAGREAFSYGPRLVASSQHRYTELDIVLREQVKDTETFQRFAWYPLYRAENLEKQYVLYRLGPNSFTLIYPAEVPTP